MSVVGRKDLNVINPPDSGESFFYSLSASDTLILDIPAGKTICYFVPFSSTNIFYTYSKDTTCLLYTSPSPRDRQKSRMPSSA